MRNGPGLVPQGCRSPILGPARTQQSMALYSSVTRAVSCRRTSPPPPTSQGLHWAQRKGAFHDSMKGRLAGSGDRSGSVPCVPALASRQGRDAHAEDKSRQWPDYAQAPAQSGCDLGSTRPRVASGAPSTVDWTQPQPRVVQWGGLPRDLRKSLPGPGHSMRQPEPQPQPIVQPGVDNGERSPRDKACAPVEVKLPEQTVAQVPVRELDQPRPGPMFVPPPRQRAPAVNGVMSLNDGVGCRSRRMASPAAGQLDGLSRSVRCRSPVGALDRRRWDGGGGGGGGVGACSPGRGTALGPRRMEPDLRWSGHHLARPPAPTAAQVPSDDGVQEALRRLEQLCPLASAAARLQGGQSLQPSPHEGPWDLIPGGLYLGTTQHAANRETLVRKGILAVLNATENDYGNLGGCPRYLCLGIKDNSEENLLAAFERARPFLEQAASARAPILIHCAFGINRSAAMSVLWLMRHYKYSLLRAFEHVMRLRKDAIVLNITFRQQLALYAARHGCIG